MADKAYIQHFTKLFFEWVCDCCLTPTQWWEKVNTQWDDNEVCFVLNQHA